VIGHMGVDIMENSPAATLAKCFALSAIGAKARCLSIGLVCCLALAYGGIERFTEIPHRLRSAAPFNGSTIKRRILATTIGFRNSDINL